MAVEIYYKNLKLLHWIFPYGFYDKYSISEIVGVIDG